MSELEVNGATGEGSATATAPASSPPVTPQPETVRAEATKDFTGASAETTTASSGNLDSGQAKAPPQKKFWRGCIHSIRGCPAFPDKFAEKVTELEKLLNRDVWLVAEGDNGLSVMHPFITASAQRKKSMLPRKPVAVLLDTYGGDAEAAYSLATLLRRRCDNFIAVVPRLATSAGTLFALGASEIILGEDAQLGPLDVQFTDYDVEEDTVSALDTVQAVEQLEQSAMDVAIKMLRQLANVTKKKHSILLPQALHFAAEITQPLFEKIDSIRYCRQHRQLREAQDYAERLLQPAFSATEAKAIAHDLTRKYPTHGFIIDRDEARKIGVTVNERTGRDNPPVGLRVRQDVAPELELLLDWFALNLPRYYGVGRLEELQTNEE